MAAAGHPRRSRDSELVVDFADSGSCSGATFAL